MTEGGAASSTRWSLEARLTSASRLIRMPGAMAPPRYSPAADTASKVVAVPKSSRMAGAP